MSIVVENPENREYRAVIDMPELGYKYEGQVAPYEREESLKIAHGVGKMTYHNGSVYEGNFDYDTRTGEGTITTVFKKGILGSRDIQHVFVGSFKYDKKHGPSKEYMFFLDNSEERKDYTKDEPDLFLEGTWEHGVFQDGETLYEKLVKQVSESQIEKGENKIATALSNGLTSCNYFIPEGDSNSLNYEETLTKISEYMIDNLEDSGEVDKFEEMIREKYPIDSSNETTYIDLLLELIDFRKEKFHKFFEGGASFTMKKMMNFSDSSLVELANIMGNMNEADSLPPGEYIESDDSLPPGEYIEEEEGDFDGLSLVTSTPTEDDLGPLTRQNAVPPEDLFAERNRNRPTPPQLVRSTLQRNLLQRQYGVIDTDTEPEPIESPSVPNLRIRTRTPILNMSDMSGTETELETEVESSPEGVGPFSPDTEPESPLSLQPRRLFSTPSPPGQRGSGDSELLTWLEINGEYSKNYIIEDYNASKLLKKEEYDLSFINPNQVRKNKLSRHPPEGLNKARKSMWFIEQYLLRIFGFKSMEGFSTLNLIRSSIIEPNNKLNNLRLIMNKNPIQVVEFQERDNVDEIDYGAFRLEFFNKLNEELLETFFEKIPGSDMYQLKEYTSTSFYKEFPFISEEVGPCLLGLVIARLLSTDNGYLYNEERRQMIKPFRLLLPFSTIFSLMFSSSIDNGWLSDPISVMACYALDQPDTWESMYKNKDNLQYLNSMFGDFVDFDEIVEFLPDITTLDNEELKSEDTMAEMNLFKKMYVACFSSYFDNVFQHKKQFFEFMNGFSQIFTTKVTLLKPSYSQFYYEMAIKRDSEPMVCSTITKDGKEIEAYSNLQALYPDDFHALYTPNEFSLELFKKNIHFTYDKLTDETKHMKEWFERFIDEIDETSAKRMLFFCCNQRALPLENYTIKLYLFKQKDRIPQAHVCFNTIDLYNSDNYETFKSGLLIALANSEGFVAGKALKKCPAKIKEKTKMLKKLEEIKKKNTKKSKKKSKGKKVKHSKKKARNVSSTSKKMLKSKKKKRN